MIASAHAGEKGLHVFEHEVQPRLLLRIWVQMGLQLLLQEAHRHTQICTVECLAHSRELLANLQTIFPFLNHPLNSANLAFSPAQAIQYIGTRLGIVQYSHGAVLITLGG